MQCYGEGELRVQLELEREMYTPFHDCVQSALDKKKEEIAALKKEVETLKRRNRSLDKERAGNAVRAQDHAKWLEEIHRCIVTQVFGTGVVPAEHSKVPSYTEAARINWKCIEQRMRAIQSLYPSVDHFMMNFVEELDDPSDEEADGSPPAKRQAVTD